MSSPPLPPDFVLSTIYDRVRVRRNVLKYFAANPGRSILFVPRSALTGTVWRSTKNTNAPRLAGGGIVPGEQIVMLARRGLQGAFRLLGIMATQAAADGAISTTQSGDPAAIAFFEAVRPFAIVHEFLWESPDGDCLVATPFGGMAP